MKNEVAKLLKMAAWITFIMGTIAALILVVAINIPMALICWASTFVAGRSCWGWLKSFTCCTSVFRRSCRCLSRLGRKSINFCLSIKA